MRKEYDNYSLFPYYFEAEDEVAIAEWAEKNLNIRKYTPDLVELNLNTDALVFVYGTLKRSGGNFGPYLSRAKPLGHGWTVLSTFEMRSMGAFPAVFYRPGPNAKAIQGEVYRCSIRQLCDIDELEQNGELYKRRKTRVKTGNGVELIAWMYHGYNLTEKQIDALPLEPSFTRKKTGVDYYTYVGRAKSR